MSTAARAKAATLDYSRPGLVDIRLIDFDVGSATLRAEHKAALNRSVTPLLVAGGSLSIAGHASRSGSANSNDALSTRRVQAVLAYLRTAVGGVVRSKVWTIDTAFGYGEAAAIGAAAADGEEDPFYRAVQVTAWRGVAPPPAPRLPEAPGPKLVKRVSYVRFAEPSNEDKYGGIDVKYADLGDAISAELFGPKRFPTQRRYVMVPEYYSLNEVHEKHSNVRTTMGPSTGVIDTREFEYVWGPWSDFVIYDLKEIYMAESILKPQSLASKKWTSHPRKTIHRNNIYREIEYLEF